MLIIAIIAAAITNHSFKKALGLEKRIGLDRPTTHTSIILDNLIRDELSCDVPPNIWKALNHDD